MILPCKMAPFVFWKNLQLMMKMNVYNYYSYKKYFLLVTAPLYKAITTLFTQASFLMQTCLLWQLQLVRAVGLPADKECWSNVVAQMTGAQLNLGGSPKIQNLQDLLNEASGFSCPEPLYKQYCYLFLARSNERD